MSEDFLYRHLPTLNKRIMRLGLGFKYGIAGKDIDDALGRGVNFFVCGELDKREQHEALKPALARDRERYVLAAGPKFGYFSCNVRAGTERLLRLFDVDYLDVLMIYWLGRTSAFTKGVQREMVRLREQGLVRSIGVSIHDRPRAGRLAVDSPLDLLMVRYNAAHPGAEQDIFPRYAIRRPMTIAYTATAWQQLLRAPEGWDGPAMTPAECYRFCLSSPHVDVVLCGARSGAEIAQNLEALRRGPLEPEEEERFRRFGAAVHG